MRALLMKNLVAHKQTNKLTSIIYALTLGCVIFLCVSLNLVILSTETNKDYPHASIVMTAEGDGAIDVTRIEHNVLYDVAYFNDIKDFGWVTVPL